MRRVILLALLLGWVRLSHGAIALEGPCTISGSTNDYGPIDSFSHTIASPTNLLAVCTHTAQASDTNDAIASITHNGDDLIPLLAAGIGDEQTELWYRLAPDLGPSLTLTVTMANDPYYISAACNFSGVAQTAPIHTQTATGSLATLSATVNSAADEYVLSCVTVTPLPASLTEGSGETERWNLGHDVVQGFGSTMLGVSPNVTPDITLETTYYASQVVVSLAPLAGAAAARRQGVLGP